MHTSPDHDARLLPWIDATGSYIPRIWADAAQKAWDLMEEIRQRPLPETGEVFNIPMLGGETGKRTDLLNRETVGSTPTQAAEAQGYLRLLNCIMHSNDERCEACGNDPI